MFIDETAANDAASCSRLAGGTPPCARADHRLPAFVADALRLGLGLSDIRYLLQTDWPGTTACCHELRRLLERQLARTDHRLEGSQARRPRIAKVLERWDEWDGCCRNDSGRCPPLILERARPVPQP